MTNSVAICLLLFLSCVCFTCSTASAYPQYECPPSHTFSKGDNTCLTATFYKSTMKRAREFCSFHYNGRVPEIKDDRTKEVFNGLIMTGENKYWVGIVRTNGSFHYLSGDPMTNVLMWDSQPHGTEGHDCVLFDGKKGLLIDSDCKTKVPVMCQVNAEIPGNPKARCPPFYFYTYSDGDASCLKAFNTRATVKEAMDICSSDHNGRIAEIRDSGTQDLFRVMVYISYDAGSIFWLGITRSSDGSRNEYMNGDPVTDIWSDLPYSTDSSSGLCAQTLYVDQEIEESFVDCNISNAFICQTNETDTTEPISMFQALRSIPGEFGKGKVFVYDVLISNYGGDYDNNTGVYTAPVDGFYLFHYSILCDNDDHIYLDLKTNTGRLLNRLRAGDNGSGNEYSDAGVVVMLTKGEQVMPVIFFNDPSGMSIAYKEKPDVSNRFTGYLLRAIF